MQRYVLHMSPQYGELRPTNNWDPSGSLRHPCKFQRVSRLCSITARHLVAGISQTLRRWTEGATCVRQGDHHVGHWPTFYCEFRMQVWNVWHEARWKYRTQKIAKNSPSGHHRTTLSGCIFATKTCIDNRGNIVKQQYLLHMFPQCGELRPTNGWDRFGSFCNTPANFNGFRVLPSLLQQHRSMEANQTLHGVWPYSALVHYTVFQKNWITKLVTVT